MWKGSTQVSFARNGPLIKKEIVKFPGFLKSRALGKAFFSSKENGYIVVCMQELWQF